jgi:nicotinamidase-related amidase
MRNVMPTDAPVPTRDLPLIPGSSALLIIDIQNYCCRRDGGMFKGLEPGRVEREFGSYLERLEEIVVPNLQRAIAACRGARVEVVYTTIEALTTDGRDRSLDYKISGVLVPRGSWDGRVLDAIRPADDEIQLPKTASSAFNATNVDYVLRNLGVERLAIAGALTDQCVESAVRDACDRGFLVTLIEDACATLSAERHTHALNAMKGYCRQVTTDALVAELEAG